jgi:Putative undecaprenyl diphosphate synthase
MRHSAILNIAAPYTSRDEMALAIRETVDEYCQPLRPRLNRPFSETHIARNIQAQRMESGGDIKPLQSFAESKEIDLPQDDLTLENDVIEYTPTSAPAKVAYGNFMIRMSEIMKEDTDSTISEEDLVGASNLALYSIKHGFFSEDEKQQDAIEIMNRQIKGVELQSLIELADTISDYPVDQSLVSDNTTLNTAGDQSSTAPNPQQYRDVEQINESTLTAHTYTGSNLPPVDILVRTSGVERLSDFLLWQCHQKTHIVFVKCMWPEFGLRQFIPLILEWQWRQKKEQRDSRMEWPKMD